MGDDLVDEGLGDGQHVRQDKQKGC
ncbi:hypothetical protein STRIP9103_03489, partial [Streptomyces ipomoeae 91-03]